MPVKRARRSTAAESEAHSDLYSDTSEEAPPRRSRSRSASVSAATARRPRLSGITPGTPNKRSARSQSATPHPEPSKARNAPKQVNTLPLPVPPIPSSTRHELFVFGSGHLGQFGMGTGQNELGTWVEPARHPFPKCIYGDASPVAIQDVACGSYHSLIVTSDGRIWSFGINDNGALGRCTTSETQAQEELETTPMVVENLDHFFAVCVSAGDSFSVALSPLGELLMWGSFRASDGLLAASGKPLIAFEPVKPNIHAKIAQIATGSDHLLALDVLGCVYTLGNGQQGQLGRKVIERRKENGLLAAKLGLRKIVHVAAGTYNSFAVTKTGKVYSWGLNGFRQCGLAEEDGASLDIIVVPSEIRSLHPSRHGGAHVVAISGGESHTLFLFDNGRVMACGRCDGGECGLDETHPAMLQAREASRDIDNNPQVFMTQHVLDGHVNDSVPKIKKDTQEEECPPAYISEPTPITFPPEHGLPPRIVSVYAGKRHNFAVSERGTCYTWGFCPHRSLGLSDTEVQSVPVPIHVHGHVFKVGIGASHVVLGVCNRSGSPAQTRAVCPPPAST